MTSKKQECFVYMTLPGQTDQITAGKYVLEKTEQGIDVGHFVYGRSYLSRADAVEIDPIELKLENKVFNTVTMKGVFGALRDASPDYWGRRIIERNLKVAQADEMTYLLQSADDRIGALGFGFNQTPPAPNRVFNQKIQLDRLQKEAELLVNEEVKPENPITAQVQELLLIGTSMGGARPKAVIEDDNKLWVAWLALSALSGCTTNINGDFCLLYEPVYADYEHDTPETVRQIDRNNVVYDDLCTN